MEVSLALGKALVKEESDETLSACSSASTKDGVCEELLFDSGCVVDAASFSLTIAGPKKSVAELARRLLASGRVLSNTFSSLRGGAAPLRDVSDPFLLCESLCDLGDSAGVATFDSSRETGLDRARLLI